MFDAVLLIPSLSGGCVNGISKILIPESEKVNDNFNDYISKEFSILPKNNLKIGISWKTSNERESIKRSVDLFSILNKIQNKKISFINLQYGDVLNEIEAAKRILKIKVLILTAMSLKKCFLSWIFPPKYLEP